MGKRNRGRQISGLVLLDKDAGCSSNQALQQVKRLFNAAKAGHTGSLDPFATGMLPICLGEATKISGFLLDACKQYLTRVRLGVQTSTGDPEGEEVERGAIPELTREDVVEALAAFIGQTKQIPPMFSALKQDGRRLYQLARDGQQVERQPRPVTITEINLLDLGKDWLELSINCSKGTYIRVLAEDIGRALGTVAHAETLRRTAVGTFGANQMLTLTELAAIAEQGQRALDHRLIAADAALGHLPSVKLDASQSQRVAHGNPVRLNAEQVGGTSGLLVRMYASDGAFVGVGELSGDGQLRTRRLILSG